VIAGQDAGLGCGAVLGHAGDDDLVVVIGDMLAALAGLDLIEPC
jgi:hypothetical protein